MPRKTKAIKKSDFNKSWNNPKLKAKKYRIEEVDKERSFLIICEGKNTEPWYFKSIPAGNVSVESYGVGQSKTALVETVLEIIKTDKAAREKEIWVVFDMDIKEDQHAQQKEDYNQAIQLAQSKNIRVAYSNDAFELWFLLHYEYMDAQLKRHQYYERLSELWECNYEREGKHEAFCRKIYQRLENDSRADRSKAIAFARKLLETYSDLPYCHHNPCTTVFRLVEAIDPLPDTQAI